MKIFPSRKSKLGLPPGTLTEVGDQSVKVKLTCFGYNRDILEVHEIQNIEEIQQFRKPNQTFWLNVEGLSELPVIKKIGEYFNLHPLLLEDVLSLDQRAKIDDYDDNVFLVAKMLSHDDSVPAVDSEQISFVLGHDYVITFQEREGDIFDYVRERLKKGKGRIVESGPDYLLYAFLDTIVDHYFVILEKIGERIEVLEEGIIRNADSSKLRELYNLKREMIFLRKSVWPLREVVNKMEKEETDLIKKPTKVYIKDVYDHTIQVIDTIESYRDVLASLMDLYLSGISNKTNAIMKVLTIISTIFIPLTFIVGIYGMNFEHMPELKWKFGYLLVWIVMIVITGAMLWLFRRKRWI